MLLPAPPTSLTRRVQLSFLPSSPSRTGRAEALDGVAPGPPHGVPLCRVRLLARPQDVGVLRAGASRGRPSGSCSLAESVGGLFSGGVHGRSVSPGRPVWGERGPNGG